jgi:glutamate 5-kinase
MQANKASLLAVGIVEVYGDFPAGKVISVQSPCGEELGRGVSYFSSKELGRIKGLKSDQYQAALGYDHPPEHIEVIHRDHLVIFETARED